MRSTMKKIFNSYIDTDYYECLKVVLLALSFFFVIGSYTLIKEIKDSVFADIVGHEYLPVAKLWSMIILIAPLFLYAKLVDWFRRSHLIYIYFLLYAVVGLICAYYLGHPVIGIPNTDTGGHRYFGWFFYFFMEGFAPFIVSLMWAFTNSISKPESVKTNYVYMTMTSKLGGMTTAGFAWWFLRNYDPEINLLSDVQSYQLLQVIASIFLVCVPIVTYMLMKYVPGRYLHGYEAVYKAEKKKKKEEKTTETTWWDSFASMLSGLKLLVRYPYMLGIMGMIFFWETLNVWVNYLRISMGHEQTGSVGEFGSYLFQQAFYTHIIGFVFAAVGTSLFIRMFGERGSLMLIPLLTGVVIGYYLYVQSLAALGITYVLMRMINSAFAYPLRESLYIPTTKELKFKTKSWIDGFGAKMSKGFGSVYNYYVNVYSYYSHVTFFICIISTWFLTAYLLGKRFDEAVENDEAIGLDA